MAELQLKSKWNVNCNISISVWIHVLEVEKIGVLGVTQADGVLTVYSPARIHHGLVCATSSTRRPEIRLESVNRSGIYRLT